MEEIFINTAISAGDVEESFKILFPDLKPFQWFPRDSNVNPIGFSEEDSTHVLFDIYEEDNRLEFHWRLSAYGQGSEERERIMAEYLSKKCAVAL